MVRNSFYYVPINEYIAKTYSNDIFTSELQNTDIFACEI